MIARLPVLATLVVGLAIATMIALGVWQLGRADEKAAIKARYADAAQDPGIVQWPAIGDDGEVMLNRRARLVCGPAADISSMAGNSAAGQSGLAITATCRDTNGEPALVILGWSRQPVTPRWNGGEVTGVIAPGPRLIADPPVAGLEASALPDPNDLPDNHFAYAMQWFFFAATALVIYVLAVRKRLAAGPREG